MYNIDKIRHDEENTSQLYRQDSTCSEHVQRTAANITAVNHLSRFVLLFLAETAQQINQKLPYRQHSIQMKSFFRRMRASGIRSYADYFHLRNAVRDDGRFLTSVYQLAGRLKAKAVFISLKADSGQR